MRRPIALVLAVMTASAPIPAQAQVRLMARPLAPSFVLGVQAPAPMMPAFSAPNLGTIAPLPGVAMAAPQAPAPVVVAADSALRALPAGLAERKSEERSVESAALDARARFDGPTSDIQDDASAADGVTTLPIFFDGPGRSDVQPQVAASNLAVGPSKAVPPEIKGNLSSTDYREPADLIGKLKMLRAGRWAGRAVYASALAAGIGLPALLASVIAIPLLNKRVSAEQTVGPDHSELAEEQQRALSSRVLILLDRLTERTGAWKGAPGVVLSNRLGKDNAAISYPPSFSAGHSWFSARLRIGDDFAAKDDRLLAGVIAHELGHLQHPSQEGSFEVRDGNGLKASLVLTGLGGVIVKIAHAAIEPSLPSVPDAFLFGADSFLWSGVLFLLGALAQLSMMVSASAIDRVYELMADHFGGWLTPPSWLAAFFRPGAARSAAYFKSWRKYSATHPSPAERIRRLEAMAAPK